MAQALHPVDRDSPTTAAERSTNYEDGGEDGPILLDYCHSSMDSHDLAEALANQPSHVFSTVQTLLATNNSLLQLPDTLAMYVNLTNLDISFNSLTVLPDSLCQCTNLQSLISRNNLLDDTSFPKNLPNLTQLRELNLSGNLLTRIPDDIVNLSPSLVTLHLGANRVSYLTPDIKRFKKLEVLYLGGNQLQEIPWQVGELSKLKFFVLCENRLESIPASVCSLKQLKSLLLHRNRLTSLPVELIKLRNLMELSLRDNPLVVRFVRDMVYNPPSLMELAARVIRIKKVSYKSADLPQNLADYLGHAHECINPRCKGVYFDSRVEHIKFVDFCGKYRIPLLQYLCSPSCSTSPAYEASDSDSDDDRIRKVLLG